MTGAVLFEHKARGCIWRLEIVTYKGHTFANWRQWFPKDGDWKPTRAGCAIPLDDLPRLTASLMAYHGLPVPDGLETAS